MCDKYTWQKAKHIYERETHLLVREDVTLRTINSTSSAQRKICGPESPGAWRKGEPIAGFMSCKQAVADQGSLRGISGVTSHNLATTSEDQYWEDLVHIIVMTYL
jgi:hypothetical protein